MADISIILNNSGNDKYAQTARDFLSNPVTVTALKIVLDNENQLSNNISIRNEKSFGSEWNRDISLRNYTNAINKTNLILDIPLNPPITLDGDTYFSTSLEANTEMDLLFYYD